MQSIVLQLQVRLEAWKQVPETGFANYQGQVRMSNKHSDPFSP